MSAGTILTISDESIRRAAALISRGDLVAFPTETVYGLGGNAFNPAALAKIFEAKGRPRFDPLIVHIAALEMLEKISDLSPLNTIMRNNIAVLIRQFWPGPLTLILPKRDIIPGLATSGLPTVAVRLPAHDAAQKLIALSTGAVAAPSANPFGYLSPTRAEHVADSLAGKIEIILDGGPTQFGLESTVLDMSGGQPRLLRPGATPREAIEAAIGPVSAPVEDGASPEAAVSPGLLKSHYAPRIPLIAHSGETMCRLSDDGGHAFLFFDGVSRDNWLLGQGRPLGEAEPKAAVLSKTGNMLEAAARLFETLHELERLKVREIHAQFAPETGLGIAINDRLRRASKGASDQPFYGGGLRFSCRRCSACCRHESGFVYLSENDLSRLANEFKMEYNAFIKTWCRWVSFDRDSERLALKEKSNFDCIFWNQHCTVYHARPLQCRTFPFWDNVVCSPEAWETAGSGCPGINTGERHTREEISQSLHMMGEELVIERKIPRIGGG